ncbi:hypothetical protein KQX54_021872 [Cotesia glomerata]|uniref:Uncharacterized protein n=1 Tax=Cotesia glomerata TaxID=32391 RepID=A0AAV7IX55_COTGL|nr:hypothetical protein KQX54_021872 [Cotesia glomerata]
MAASSVSQDLKSGVLSEQQSSRLDSFNYARYFHDNSLIQWRLVKCPYRLEPKPRYPGTHMFCFSKINRTKKESMGSQRDGMTKLRDSENQEWLSWWYVTAHARAFCPQECWNGGSFESSADCARALSSQRLLGISFYHLPDSSFLSYFNVLLRKLISYESRQSPDHYGICSSINCSQM